MSKASSKSPSLMRYARVQQVLEQEPAFVAKMSARSETVCKPNGEQQKFSPEVIVVTQTIHDSGKDAHKVHKTEIVRIACQVFKIGRQAAAPETNGAVAHTPAPAPAPVIDSPPPAPEASKPAPKATPKPAKAQSKPPAKPAPAPKPAKAQVPPQPVATPEPPKEAPKQTVAPAPVEAESREAILAKAKEALLDRPGENVAAFNAYISAYSLVLTALQIIEIYDNQPGKDKRLKVLDDMAKEVNKYTSIKGAKEAQKAQS